MKTDWQPTNFRLVRDEDETGVSGTGVVATGCVWPDGVAVMRWRPGAAEVSSTAVYGSLADVERIHGHNGKTRVDLSHVDPVFAYSEWLDADQHLVRDPDGDERTHEDLVGEFRNTLGV